MRKKMLGFAIALLSALFILSACGGAEANPEFLGRWLRQPTVDNNSGIQIYAFNSGGEGVFHDGQLAYRGLDETEIIWNIDGDRLEIFFGGQLRAEIYNFEFEDDDTLVLRRIGWPEWSSIVLTRIED